MVNKQLFNLNSLNWNIQPHYLVILNRTMSTSKQFYNEKRVNERENDTNCLKLKFPGGYLYQLMNNFIRAGIANGAIHSYIFE